jgi:hypothetical protein
VKILVMKLELSPEFVCNNIRRQAVELSERALPLAAHLNLPGVSCNS